jgi:hypothetical protein
MLVSFLFAMIAGAAPGEYLPCDPGRRIEYRSKSKAKIENPVTSIIETVRGLGREPHSCVVDQLLRKKNGNSNQDARVYERLADRVLEAGWLGYETAFRRPLLKSPLELGASWVFNRTQYRVVGVGACPPLPAGRFDDCVGIQESDMSGGHLVLRVYARGIGLVLKDGPVATWTAERVSASKETSAGQCGMEPSTESCNP